MHTAEDNQVTIAVHEHFSQLVKLQVTYAVSKLLLTFRSTVLANHYNILHDKTPTLLNTFTHHAPWQASNPFYLFYRDHFMQALVMRPGRMVEITGKELSCMARPLIHSSLLYKTQQVLSARMDSRRSRCMGMWKVSVNMYDVYYFFLNSCH